MTPQTESQFFYDTLYPALTFKSGLFSVNHTTACLLWVLLCREVGRVKMLIITS